MYDDNIFSLLLNVGYTLMKIQNKKINEFNDLKEKTEIIYNISKNLFEKDIKENQNIDLKTNNNSPLFIRFKRIRNTKKIY